MSVSSIQNLRDITSTQYWTVENGPIEVVDKPDWKCFLFQSMDFIEVLSKAAVVLDAEADKSDNTMIIRTCVANLNRRYNHWVDSQSSLSKVITSLFFWIHGYNVEEIMRKINAHDPLSCQWKEKFSENLFSMDMDDLEALKREYSLGSVVSHIEKLKKEGKAVGLVIGFETDQSLPPNTDEAVLFSGSQIMGSSRSCDYPLWLNFNQDEALVPLKGLFDVVFIRSELVGKMKTGVFVLVNDFAARLRTLLSDDGVMLIAVSRDPSIDDDLSRGNEVGFDKNRYKFLMPDRLFDLKPDTPEQLKQDEDAYYTFFKAHLETLFETVLLGQGEDMKDYPIKPDNEKDYCFLLQHPKTT